LSFETSGTTAYSPTKRRELLPTVLRNVGKYCLHSFETSETTAILRNVGNYCISSKSRELLPTILLTSRTTALLRNVGNYCLQSYETSGTTASIPSKRRELLPQFLRNVGNYFNPSKRWELLPPFLRNVGNYCIPSKHQEPLNQQHGVTLQKT
jgi:hypothetical protein